MADEQSDALADLMGPGRKPATARRMSDVLGLPEQQQALIHWMMRTGEVVLAQVAEQFTDKDEEAAAQLLAQLVSDGFVQEWQIGGVSHYRAHLMTRTGRALPRQIWQALYDKLTDVFDHEGTSVELGGNRPLLLGEAGAVWMVRSGRVHVFGVAIRSGEPVGMRTYLFGAEEGDALFGLGGGQDGVGLIAVGTPGTVLKRLQLSRLQELSSERRHAEQVAGLVGDWVARVQATMALEQPPRDVQPLAAGERITLAAGTHARTMGNVLWAAVGSGAVHVAGRSELTVGPETGLFPLCGQVWATAARNSVLTVSTTAAWMSEDPSWAALGTLHEFVLKGLAANFSAEGQRQLNRLKARAEADARSVISAVSHLSAALEPGAAEAARTAEDGGDPLLAACRLVGEALAIPIHPPARSERGQGKTDALSKIARASRVRTRRVALRGEWWKQDNGPILGYRQDGQPVALLPDNRGHYVLVDPVTRARTPVTPEVAASLDPFAVVIYRPFPEQAMAATDLIRFGARGVLRDWWTVLILGAFGGLVVLITPVLTGVIFDSVIPGARRSDLLAVVLALVVAAFASAIFQLTRSIAFLRVEGKMSGSVQSAVWDRLLSLPVPFFREYSAGDLANRAMGIEGIRRLLTGSVTGSLLAGIFSLFSWLLLFYYSVRLALVATVLDLVVVAVTALGSLAEVRYQRKLFALQGKLSGKVLQLITGVPKLRVAGAESRAYAVWARYFGEQKALAMRAKLTSLPAFDAAWPVISTLILFAVVAAQGRTGLSTGAFLAFVAAFNQFLDGSLAASKALTATLQAVPYYERAKPIFTTLPESDSGKSDPGELSGDVEISHVAFRYSPDGPPILKDVSLHVKPGQFVAIVGPSGTGKSTIFRLLLGFEKPEAGAIFYDGQDLTGLDVRAVRRQIGVVLQNGKVQPGDIFSNIVGSSQLSLQDAWEAARMAGLDEDIKAMPMGMQTVVTDGGSTLSGGQRQRLLIARAIVNRPRILLFDEATSALDNRTQAIISKSLETLHATRIVIAHRLSTVINADCIYVLQGGMIVQAGTYEELINQRGPFQELAKRQLA